MSITTQQTVWCDVCGNWDQLTGSIAYVRRYLKKQWWVRRKKDGVLQDVCPNCVKKEKDDAVPPHP